MSTIRINEVGTLSKEDMTGQALKRYPAASIEVIIDFACERAKMSSEATKTPWVVTSGVGPDEITLVTFNGAGLWMALNL